MINFLVSIFSNLTLITLTVSVTSFAYAVWNNKYSVEVTDIKFETNREHYYLTFKLTNTSTKSLKIEKITLSKNNQFLKSIFLQKITIKMNESEKLRNGTEKSEKNRLVIFIRLYQG